MPKSGSFIGKLAGFLFLFAVLMLIVKGPAQAADWTGQIVTFLQRLIEGLVTFLTDVMKGQ